MAMPWDLEDWLTEIGDRVVRKMAASGPETLTPQERLIYEVWIFDTETRNCGVSISETEELRGGGVCALPLRAGRCRG